MANTPRTEFVQWMKDRALAELEAEGSAQALVSLMSDMGKWDGGELYCHDQVRILMAMGMRAVHGTLQEMRSYIEGMT